MRRKVFALVVGSDFRHLLFWWAVRCGRRMKTLSIFVDESGRFQHPDADSRFYILGMVFHDQSHDISRIVADLERSELELGLEGHCFHAGPLIRKEKGYEIMSRRFRGRILSRMMAFADRIDFKYHCLSVDKKFIDNAGQIVEHLRHSLQLFIDANRAMLTAIDSSPFPVPQKIGDSVRAARGLNQKVEAIAVLMKKYRHPLYAISQI